MNCQQKSGIFLNMSCSNEAIKECSNCGKKVCKTHFHLFRRKKFCEDCYWEYLIYAKQTKTSKKNKDTTTYVSTATTSSSSTNSSKDEGFKGGFGGGEFGGAGASGVWTDGDKQGFDTENAVSGADLFDDNNDSTFFYS